MTNIIYKQAGFFTQNDQDLINFSAPRSVAGCAGDILEAGGSGL